jgi:hypothetical protein
MDGWKDPALWEVIQAHQQFLVTGDKGFGDLRRYAIGASSFCAPQRTGFVPS